MRLTTTRVLWTTGPLAAALLAALGPACDSVEGWHCCQSTPYTCVCSASGYCSGADVIDKCSVDTVPGADNVCCAHGDAASCSCSGSDGGIESDGQCTSDGDALVDDCTTEPVIAPSGDCSAGEPGTTSAPCAVDSDCYSAFCDTATSTPVCATPTRTARVEGHGYDCMTDADCEGAAPDVVARGGVATCHDDATLAGCELTCGASAP